VNVAILIYFNVYEIVTVVVLSLEDIATKSRMPEETLHEMRFTFHEMRRRCPSEYFGTTPASCACGIVRLTLRTSLRSFSASLTKKPREVFAHSPGVNFFRLTLQSLAFGLKAFRLQPELESQRQFVDQHVVVVDCVCSTGAFVIITGE